MSDDRELEALRKKRLQELQNEQLSQQQLQQQQEQRAREIENQRQMVLKGILSCWAI